MYAKQVDSEIQTITSLKVQYSNTSFPSPLPSEHDGWKKVIDKGGTAGEKKSNIIEQNGDFVQTYEIDRDAIAAHLTFYRYQREIGGVVYGDYTYHTDRESRGTWLGLYLQSGNDTDFVLPVYKAIDGVARNLNAKDIKAIYQVGTEHISKCFIAEDRVAQSIDSYTTFDEIEKAFEDAYAGL